MNWGRNVWVGGKSCGEKWLRVDEAVMEAALSRNVSMTLVVGVKCRHEILQRYEH